MSGTSSIRAMNTEDYAIETNSENENIHLLTQQIAFATFTWYSTRLMFSSCFSTFFTGNLCLYNKFKGGDTILMGMAFKSIVHIGYRFNELVHISGDFEKRLCSIQKCFKLLTIPQEKEGQPRHEGKNWPRKGGIEFKDVELRYKPTTKLVLK